jgi:hypothetical protein
VAVSGQTNLIFQLDLSNLINARYYCPDSGERVFTRGTFNQWQGDDLDLTSVPGSSLHKGRFLLKITGEIFNPFDHK